MRPYILLATIGGQAQICTHVLDELIDMGQREHFTIEELIVLHPSDPRTCQSVSLIEREFVENRFYLHRGIQKVPCRFSRCEIPVERIRGQINRRVAQETIYRQIHNLKREKRHLHLSLSGGLRFMALFAMTQAMTKLDMLDFTWHIDTPEEVKEAAANGVLMHIEPGIVELVEVPIVGLGEYFPAREQQEHDPYATRRMMMDRYEVARCHQVVAHLAGKTETLAVLRAYAQGLSQQEVAEGLGKALPTVRMHTTIILDLIRNAWILDPETRISYQFIRQHFRGYFDQKSALMCEPRSQAEFASAVGQGETGLAKKTETEPHVT
jgi:DNA-directed RNA polymerase specialized sigma24 family protein